MSFHLHNHDIEIGWSAIAVEEEDNNDETIPHEVVSNSLDLRIAEKTYFCGKQKSS